MSLDQLAIKHGTDKSSKHHNYTPIYDKYFGHLRNEPITVLELGHGGYHYYDRGGESAKMWRDYFYKGRIVSIDIHDKAPIDGVEFHQGSQADPYFLVSLIEKIGKPDIIIDDGCHRSPETVRSYEILFPFLKDGGIYVVEDLEASYWGVASDGQDFGGGLTIPNSSVNYLKGIVDEINQFHSGVPNMYKVSSIHFYEKIAFIFK